MERSVLYTGIHMFAIGAQGAGPNGLTFFEETQG